MRRFVIKKGRSDNVLINPFVAGILITILVELVFFFVLALYLYLKNK